MAITRDDVPGVDWVGGTGEFISVNPDQCVGCGDCMKVCLGGCYTVSGKKAVIRSLDTCLECGACWYVCTHEAILFSWPRGGTGFRTRWG